LTEIVFLTEAGLILLDESLNPRFAARFEKGKEFTEFHECGEGKITQAVSAILEQASKIGAKSLSVPNAQLQALFSSKGFDTLVMEQQMTSQLASRKFKILMDAGIFSSEMDAREFLRDFSLEASKQRIRELSAKPDLQVMEGVQALDEIDKALNLATARLKEWYGLHFPELSGLVDDPVGYAKIASAGTRDKIDELVISGLNFSEKKTEALMTAAEESKGGSLSENDAGMIALMAETVIRLTNSRDRLQKYVESAMRRIAPNMSAIAGETIGARLIAKAGGLERIAKLPSSTIQVLGAEKALFRALKTGSKPPKHGILFQHEHVHGAPKWQRGKIARSLAGKIAIAARVDAFRGEKQEGIQEKFAKRLEEIQTKYKEAPEEPQRKPQLRKRDRRGRR
jgi:nucleolar protein 56